MDENLVTYIAMVVVWNMLLLFLLFIDVFGLTRRRKQLVYTWNTVIAILTFFLSSAVGTVWLVSQMLYTTWNGHNFCHPVLWAVSFGIL